MLESKMCLPNGSHITRQHAVNLCVKHICKTLMEESDFTERMTCDKTYTHL